MIAIIDYGAGNLLSVKNALDYIGEKNIITNDKTEIEKADSYILPGVGAFPYAMQKLVQSNLILTIKEQTKKKPLFGICLGMQMLLDESDEIKMTKGLSMISGRVDKITDMGLKIPHMGWNKLIITKSDNEIMKGINTGDYVYFVHSFKANVLNENLIAYSEYGEKIPAFISKDNIYASQFHPEKSGEIGLMMLRNFGGLSK